MKISLSLRIILVSSFMLIALDSILSKRFVNHFYNFSNSSKIKLQTQGESNKFVVAVITGNKRILSKELKTQFKDLGIYHLLTPSGLHLHIITHSLFYIYLSKKLKSAILIGCLSFLYYLGGFLSLKRMAIFQLINLAFPKAEKNVRYYALIIISLISGSFEMGNLSFYYSFLFLGVFIFSKNSSEIIIGLWISQIILSSINGSSLYVLSIFSNLFLTGIFTLIYPFLIFGYICNIGFIQNSLTSMYMWLIENFHLLITFTPKFYFSISMTIIILLILCNKKKLSLLLIFIYSFNLNNGSPESIKLKNKYVEIKKGSVEPFNY